jgi:hypothetical protein
MNWLYICKVKKLRFGLKCSRVGFGFMPIILKELKPCGARVIRLVFYKAKNDQRCGAF